MTEDRYKKIMGVLSSRRIYGTVICWADRIITAAVFLTYVAGLIYALFYYRAYLFPMIAVPGVSFVLVSIFRSFYDAIRPYEAYATAPILKKDTSGKSFPSRHIFSIFVIGTTYAVIAHHAGSEIGVTISVILFVLGAIQAALRVMGGVHFIRDVAAGAIVGVLCGLITASWIG